MPPETNTTSPDRHVSAHVRLHGPHWGSRRRLIILALCLLILIPLSAYGAFALAHQGGAPQSQRQSATQAQLATPTPFPRVLYQADWSHGANGWTLPPHWHIAHGNLVNDGYGNNMIAVPLLVTSLNYALEFRLQALSITDGSGCGNFFGVIAQNTNGVQQYEADASCLDARSPFHGQTDLVTTGDYPTGAKDWEYVVGSNPKTYRVEVYGNNVSFFPGVVSMGSLNSPMPLSPARLFIEDSSVNLVITQLRILQL